MKLTDLRKICEAATTYNKNWIADPWGDKGTKVVAGMATITGFLPNDAAQFIATFNPAFVAKLLDVVEAELNTKHVGVHLSKELEKALAALEGEPHD